MQLAAKLDVMFSSYSGANCNKRGSQGTKNHNLIPRPWDSLHHIPDKATALVISAGFLIIRFEIQTCEFNSGNLIERLSDQEYKISNATIAKLYRNYSVH